MGIDRVLIHTKFVDILPPPSDHSPTVTIYVKSQRKLYHISLSHASTLGDFFHMLNWGPALYNLLKNADYANLCIKG